MNFFARYGAWVYSKILRLTADHDRWSIELQRRRHAFERALYALVKMTLRHPSTIRTTSTEEQLPACIVHAMRPCRQCFAWPCSLRGMKLRATIAAAIAVIPSSRTTGGRR